MVKNVGLRALRTVAVFRDNDMDSEVHRPRHLGLQQQAALSHSIKQVADKR